MPNSYVKRKCFLIVEVLVLQAQMLTLVEYLVLLYRALLPAPVWYRFFLNKEYGSLFSSLMTGLYLTFKLTSVVEKVWFFCKCSLINIVQCLFNNRKFVISLWWLVFLKVEKLFYIDHIPFFPNHPLGWWCSGPILLCCFEGIVLQRDPLWCLCNIRAGSAISTLLSY